MGEVVGLFAGVGGIEEGLRRAGLATSALAEVEPGARAVLADRFPEADLLGDVTALERLPGGTRVLAAGFPCQDLSATGAKAGLAGARSGLVAHVFRLLARPGDLEWLAMENVPFMLRLDGGAAMAVIAAELEALGWRWAYRTVDAICAVPQRRRRLIMVASPVHDPATVLFADDHPAADDRSWSAGTAAGFYWTEGRDGAGLRREAVPTIKVGSGKGIPSAPAILDAEGRLGMPSIRDAERLQGFPAGWTKAAEGLAYGARWKLVGNAVPPPLAEWVGGRIVRPAPEGAEVRRAPLVVRRGWPGAACGARSGRYEVRVGEGFTALPRPLLSEVLADPLTPLSRRARDGFLKRARGGTLRWPPGFLEGVEQAA